MVIVFYSMALEVMIVNLSTMKNCTARVLINDGCFLRLNIGHYF